MNVALLLANLSRARRGGFTKLVGMWECNLVITLKNNETNKFTYKNLWECLWECILIFKEKLFLLVGMLVGIKGKNIPTENSAFPQKKQLVGIVFHN